MRILSSSCVVLSLLGVAACGSSGPTASGADSSSLPGWKAVSPAPATLGTLSLSQQGTTLEGGLSTHEGDLPSGDLTVLVRWDGTTTEQPIGTMRAADGEHFRGGFEPPACAGSPAPKGTLIVRTGGVLVGVSNVDRTLFRAPYLASFQIEASCAPATASAPTPRRALPPIPLAVDARLPLALCLSKETGTVRCGVDVLPEVRVAAASASIHGDGSVLLSFSPVYVPPGETPELTINGVRVEPYAPGVWQAQFPARDSAPLQAGDNEIVWSIGARPPWRARLELPRTLLRPRAGALQVGRSFVVEAESAPWAHHYDVSIDAVVSPPLKATFFFSSVTPRIEGTFDGFRHDARTTAPASAARLSVTARGGGRGFDIAQSETLEVPIL